MPKSDTLAAIATQTKHRASRKDRTPRAMKADPFAPTPEQREHAVYVEQDIVDVKAKGRVTIGKAFRKQPRFETMEGIGTEQLKALRCYRAAFDASEMSETKCALDVRPRGAAGSHGAISAIESRAFGASTLRGIECQLGALVHTLRDVALMDLTFSEAAMKRFGSREVDWIDVGKGKRKPRSIVKLAPKSGTHRQIIRDEFFSGLRLLIDAAAPYLSRKAIRSDRQP
ncbi:hypothetical protein [Novosphingobium sp. ST904]|uniref:hypothetical protein n=1 Tax=Novosphingobium sp. ST904 TaxID=1684385 RepID=UPI0006C8CB0F|nr:hypothetical protein [Novosphingobium sp. ST904]KPH66890.1 hypothetical protein ADT71_03810 [Novosphingobium sp. ST904]TCM39134.1 hypothetical protein EDF59_10613 [Novosphingobium sp. ST904]